MSHFQKLFKAKNLEYQLNVIWAENYYFHFDHQDERFKVILVPFFILGFNLLSSESDNFIFRLLYWVTGYWYYIKRKWIYNTFTVPCELSKMVSFTSSIMKDIVVLNFWLIFSVKLIFFFTFGLSCLLFTEIHCYHLIILFEIGII